MVLLALALLVAALGFERTSCRRGAAPWPLRATVFSQGDLRRNVQDENLPADAVSVPYVGSWSYYHRQRGMQTSTDDVLVAALACKPHLFFSSGDNEQQNEVSRYLDLGTGIGSSLLLVAHNARPQQYSIGVEAQEMSVQCLQRTLSEISEKGIDIRALHRDLRDLTLEDFQGFKFDVITANPPFAPPSSGTLCADEQRRYARFELRGGVEEYCSCASRLLAEHGRFVLAFWVKQDGRRRVEEAARSAGLVIPRRIDVIAGAPSNTKPHLHIFEMKRGGEAGLECDEFELDIRRDPLTGGLSKTYLSIMRELGMQQRPLKPLVA